MMISFSTLRGLLTLLIAPPATLLISVIALVDLKYIRKTPAKAQIFPRFWGKMICALAGVTVRVEGMENIDAQQTYIFVGNHASQFDIFTFQGFFPHDFRWLAKKELFHIPVIGWAMEAIGFIAIDRSCSRKAVTSLNQAASRIREGASVLLFPEGTRSPDGRLHPFKGGAILLAIKAGVPLVPIGFNNTHRILPKGKLLAKPGEVIIRIGTPLPTNTFQARDREQLATRLYDHVAALLNPDQLPHTEKTHAATVQ